MADPHLDRSSCGPSATISGQRPPEPRGDLVETSRRERSRRVGSLSARLRGRRRAQYDGGLCPTAGPGAVPWRIRRGERSGSSGGRLRLSHTALIFLAVVWPVVEASTKREDAALSGAEIVGRESDLVPETTRSGRGYPQLLSGKERLALTHRRRSVSRRALATAAARSGIPLFCCYQPDADRSRDAEAERRRRHAGSRASTISSTTTTSSTRSAAAAGGGAGGPQATEVRDSRSSGCRASLRSEQSARVCTVVVWGGGGAGARLTRAAPRRARGRSPRAGCTWRRCG